MEHVGPQAGRDGYQILDKSYEGYKRGIRWRDEIMEDGSLEEGGRGHHDLKPEEPGYWERVTEMRAKSRMARILASCMAMAAIAPFRKCPEKPFSSRDCLSPSVLLCRQNIDIPALKDLQTPCAILSPPIGFSPYSAALFHEALQIKNPHFARMRRFERGSRNHAFST